LFDFGGEIGVRDDNGFYSFTSAQRRFAAPANRFLHLSGAHAINRAALRASNQIRHSFRKL
jgi:hypothetical protein